METVKKKRHKAFVDQVLCAACGCCARACPTKAIAVYRGLYAQVDRAKCVGCGKCAKECPASVIQIQEEIL